MSNHAEHNARVWDQLARRGAPLTRPATEADLRNPLRAVDPQGWLGDSIAGWRVLCLAAGGGRQSVLFAAAGAEVTVLDVSPEMLAHDRRAAAERGLAVRVVEGTMEDLSAFATGGFDLVAQPVSTCYVPDVVRVYRQVARVVRPGGLYLSQHKSPVSQQATDQPAAGGYTVAEPYYREGPLPAAAPGRLREAGTLEYLHRWEQLIGGMCLAGFAIEGLVEPLHAQPDAAPGEFAHRGQFIAPYVRVKARRADSESPRSKPTILSV
ncbi:Ubiquinone biosynthesis O-methyltransferase [Posidoniimonas polymericola]|uniref:Ubiquinone biosynthesis O-methyltransferase n=1 Tax=Posidoniimonas polymericola TaxID=2528002 RepID=A0A5C5ZF41_9BACT|nr:class I SAM-dependent methyltransferase [Posidoniimonas polymericola]TWT85798.1 Ubiquinone biosynthesis O-methyltransferase [Posidoniimonas polymericola]